MKGNFKGSLIAVAVAAAIAAPAAHATNGYFVHSNSTKSSGMGGASIAYAQDAMASASNPAGIAFVGNRADASLMLFNPRRDARLDASQGTLGGLGGEDSGEVDSGATLFAIPNLGFIFNMGNIATGLSVVANGGMNTRYNSNIYANSLGSAIGCNATAACSAMPGFASTGFAGALEAGALGAPIPVSDATLDSLYSNPYMGSTLGVNLAHVIIAPTVATKINQDHALGASLLVGYQQFRAYGLGMFTALSSDPTHVTNKGNDDAWGAGVRLGWTGNVTSNITVGAQYSSKIYMQEFERYAGLFAEQGDFDIPANFGIGLAVKMTPNTTVAFDVQRIQYGDVAAIANKGPTADQFMGALAGVLTGGVAGSTSNPLGTDAGWGFGWEDITVYKLGVSHVLNSQWTVRGGVDIGENPIDDDQNLFNILAPGVVKKHLMLGFTYSPDQYTEISASLMHALREDQRYTYQGTGSFAPFSYDAEIGMDQNAIEVSYGMKF